MDDDERLATDLARDLDGTFERVVRAHADRLYSIALRMLADPRDAEEAAQDALVRAYRAIASYEAERIVSIQLRPWLATIVLNLCRTRAGRRARRGAPPLSLDVATQDRAATLAEPTAPVSQGPVAIAERGLARDAWAARLAAVPAQYRAPLVLRHVDGLSYPEVARVLGRPEGTVKAQVHRGIAILKTMLESEARLEQQEMTA